MTNPAHRLQRACELLKAANIDAAAFVPGPNFAYLTGVDLHLMERPTLFVLTARGEQHAIIPALEKHQWSAAMPDTETYYWADEDGPGKAFDALSAGLGDCVLGVEGLRMRAAEYLLLRQHWPESQLKNADSALVPMRICKDAAEIADLRRAIHISETALAEVMQDTRAGDTEVAIVARLKAAMLSHGAVGFAFEPIVLSGAEAANPHGHPGDRKLQSGQALLIDFGASYGVMHADITRTFFVEHVADSHQSIYETVKAANEQGKQAVAPGVPVEMVDAAATSVLANSPYAEMILHKTGHGLGREVHEAPQVMRGNTMPLESGMVITIEPGLYHVGDIGVRIEDDVLVTDTGYESLTSYGRDIQIIGQ
jgi:Xaa-Pro dipeptidase